MRPLRALTPLAAFAICAGLVAPIAPSASAVAEASPVDKTAFVDLSVPRLAEPRLRQSGTGLVVDTAVRVDTGHVAGSGHDRIRLQVAVVSPKDGGFIVGAPQAAAVTDSRMSATLPLTPAQSSALAQWRDAGGWPSAANAVTVGVRHEADLDSGQPGVDAYAIDTRIARWGGAAPVAPVAQVRGVGRQVKYVNSTPNPLVLLGGPANCMYDANYPLETGSNKSEQFLAQVNGAVLPKGVSLITSTGNSQNMGDDKYATTSAQVMAAYSAAMTNTYQWLSRTALKANLPKVPARSTLPPQVTGSQVQLIQSLLAQQAQDATSDGGLFDQIYTTVSLSAGIPFTWAGAAGAFDLPGVDQVLAIVGAVFDEFLSSCADDSGVFLVGATDATHPWRQFVGLYDWYDGYPQIVTAGKSKQQYSPYMNGMVVTVFTSAQSTDQSVQGDYVVGAGEPISANVPQILFTFQQPDYQAQHPADITLSGRTVTCALDADDLPGQQQAMNAVTAPGTQWFLTSWPASVWQRLDNAKQTTQSMPTSPSGLNAYVDGLGYAAPGTPGIVTVYTSADGKNWSAPLPAPANSASVTIPASTTARLVQCTVQSVETWNGSVMYNGRRAIMGTRVMSDMVLGPDA